MSDSFEETVDQLVEEHREALDRLRDYDHGWTYEQLRAEMEHAGEGYAALLEAKDKRIAELGAQRDALRDAAARFLLDLGKADWGSMEYSRDALIDAIDKAQKTNEK